MKEFKCFLLALIGGFALILAVQAKDQSGFISLDCGAEQDYIDDGQTNLHYKTDANYINIGESKRVPMINNIPRQLQSLRSFPQGDRICYNINVRNGTKYLIRASFLHGNYDHKGDDGPIFDLYLGAKKWDTVNASDVSSPIYKEIIHIASSNYIYVCLMKNGSGIPFISALEFRPLYNIYNTTWNESLVNHIRWNVATDGNEIVRFPDDVYDRIWLPVFVTPKELSKNGLQRNTTAHAVDNSHNSFRPPVNVMRSAATMSDSNDELNLTFLKVDSASRVYAYLHFAELERLQRNDHRSFQISMNEDPWGEPMDPVYLTAITRYSTKDLRGGKYQFLLSPTKDSTLPPLLNAVECYLVKDLSQPETDQEDVDAIMKIKHAYSINDWQGDPCAPQNPRYKWNGLNCSNVEPPRIISLRLPSRELTGEISPSLANLTMLQYLDLSNNSLTGKVPEFSELSSLEVLDLSGNTLTGSVPHTLLERAANQSLTLRVEGNPKLCTSVSCSKKSNFVVPLVASLASLSFLVAILAIFWSLKRRTRGGDADAKSNISDGTLDLKNKRYTHAEILRITDNFKTFLGQGSFGDVFHGYLENGTEVAVKILSELSSQGIKQFLAEVKLLVTVHHRNLTTFFGYCDEGSKIGLIYEYMANGNLKERLSDSRAGLLSWEMRLRIAVEAGQGLEYLHDGCKPPTIHRDVKSTNILLDDKFHAKIADFGLSRTVNYEATNVAGTVGYLDPEYLSSNSITEKSDVYSFGVVILEIITSRPVFTKSNNESQHLRQWIDDMISQGDIKNIVDSRLLGEYDVNSAWQAIEVAMHCVSPTSFGRPNMSHVVRELKECLAMEVARKDGDQILN